MNRAAMWIWSGRQRVGLSVVVLLLAAWLWARAVREPAHVDDPPAPAGSLAGRLATRIDPNTADWAAWSALPLVGEKRARQIVAWREQFLVDHPGEVAFAVPEDLMKVKGIGKATVAALQPYLIFPRQAGER